MEKTKQCRDCRLYKALDLFTYSASCHDRLRPECKSCYNSNNRAKYAAKVGGLRPKPTSKKRDDPKIVAMWGKKSRQKHKGRVAARLRKRVISKLQRAPKWLTKTHFQQIEIFYEAAAALTKEFGIVMVVDHIIPLRGKNVSGLHVPTNLQILTNEENRRKSNKYDLIY